MDFLNDLAKHYFPIVTDGVRGNTLRYLFRIISSKELTARIRDELGPKTNVIRFRKALIRQGYVFNIKAWLLAVIHYECTTKEEIKRLAKAYEVRDSDLCLTEFLYEEDIQQYLREYSMTYKVMTLSGFRKAIRRIVNEVDVYTKKFANKKLRFIMKSNHYDLEDFTLELIAKGIQSLILMYPCVKGSLHSTNIVKQAIHNHGINIIHQHTAKKKTTLVRFSDGTFGSLKISYDTLLNERSYDKTAPYMTTDIGGNSVAVSDVGTVEEARLDVQMSIEQMSKGAKPKQKKFLSLLMGEHDKRFTSWLNERGVTNRDNDDWHNMLINKGNLKRYINMTLDYLGVPREAGYSYLGKLQISLGV